MHINNFGFYLFTIPKEMQLIIDEEAEKKIEKQQIETIRNIKETLKLTTQQAMDAMKIPSDKQVRYANMV